MTYFSRLLFRKFPKYKDDDYRACKSSRAFSNELYEYYYKDMIRIFLQNFIFIQGNSTALCFPRFLLSYKLGKIEKLKDTKILKYKKGKK